MKKGAVIIWLVVASWNGALFSNLFANPLDHWTPSATGSNSNVTSAAYGNGRFVELSSYNPFLGALVFSDDGLEWHNAICGGQPCSPVSMLAVIHADNRFVAVGDESWIYTSTNGLDWLLNVAPPSDSTLWDVTRGESNFVAVGQMDSCPCGFVTVSDDATNWQPNYVTEVLGLRSVAYGKGLFVTVGPSDTGSSHTRANIFTSTNPLAQWKHQQTSRTNDFSSVAFGAGVFVAVGQEHFSRNGYMVTSTDGQTWSDVVLPTTSPLRKVNFVQGTFFAVGDDGVLLTSANGVDWTLRPTGAARPILGPIFHANGSVLALLGTGQFLKSDPLLELRITLGQTAQLAITGLPGRFCQIESTTNPASQNWDYREIVKLNDGPVTWNDNAQPISGSRFYRAFLLP